MRYVFAILIWCSGASAQPATLPPIAVGDDGVTIRLLRQALDRPDEAIDAETLAAAKVAAGLPPSAQLTREHVRTLLVARVGAPATRTAIWLDDGEWLPGTKPAEKAATVTALLDRAQLDVIVVRAANALHPYPARPSEFRRATGDAEPVDTQREQREATKAFLALVLRVRVETGAWPPMLSTEQRQALVQALRGLDVRGIAPSVP